MDRANTAGPNGMAVLFVWGPEVKSEVKVSVRVLVVRVLVCAGAGAGACWCVLVAVAKVTCIVAMKAGWQLFQCHVTGRQAGRVLTDRYKLVSVSVCVCVCVCS